MARPRDPIDILTAKGKKHLTKAEIETRKGAEVGKNDDHIAPPAYLSAKQKREFNTVATELKRLEIMGNLDCDVLAMYLIAREQYLCCQKKIKSIKQSDPLWKDEMADLMPLQEKAFKQCLTCAREMGMTIVSRCRLVVPKAKEEPVANKFLKFQA